MLNPFYFWPHTLLLPSQSWAHHKPQLLYFQKKLEQNIIRLEEEIERLEAELAMASQDKNVSKIEEISKNVSSKRVELDSLYSELG